MSCFVNCKRFYDNNNYVVFFTGFIKERMLQLTDTWSLILKLTLVVEVTFVEVQAQYFDLLPFDYMPYTNLNVGQLDLSNTF